MTWQDRLESRFPNRKTLEIGERSKRRWTPEEDSVIRDFYGKVGVAEILERLPSRSYHSVVNRAIKFGLTAGRWTFEEQQRLRTMFGFTPVERIAQALGRSCTAVAKCANKLGLKSAQLTEGYELIRPAAEARGYCFSEMKRILRYGNVAGNRLMVNPSCGTKRKRGRQLWYATADIDEAVQAWLRTETPGEASERVGVNCGVLRQWLRQAGVDGEPRARIAKLQAGRKFKNRKHWRIDKGVIDQVVRDRVRSDNARTAGKRHGIHWVTVCHIFRDANVPRQGRHWVISPERVDELCNMYHQRQIDRIRKAVAYAESKVHRESVSAERRVVFARTIESGKATIAKHSARIAANQPKMSKQAA